MIASCVTTTDTRKQCRSDAEMPQPNEGYAHQSDTLVEPGVFVPMPTFARYGAIKETGDIGMLGRIGPGAGLSGIRCVCATAATLAALIAVHGASSYADEVWSLSCSRQGSIIHEATLAVAADRKRTVEGQSVAVKLGRGG